MGLREIWEVLKKEPCTMWFEGAFGIDWSMSCWAHDRSWMEKTIKAKVESDFALFMDIWAISDLAKKWWQVAVLKLNAIAMLAAVATVGWVLFLPRWFKSKWYDIMDVDFL